MRVRDWQAWVQAFDEARGWERVAPEHVALHVIEELGEVARELLRERGYKEGESRLGEELADLLLILFKLANARGVDLEAALEAKARELEARFPLEASRRAMARYLEANDAPVDEP